MAQVPCRRSNASFKSTNSSQTSYSHLLYSLQPLEKKPVIVTIEESHFSSCSTSPNTSCESLDTFVTPFQRRSHMSNISVAPSALSAALSRSSSNRTSKSSCASSRYADDHYPLITTVSGAAQNINATVLEMAHAYNTYIRAINSCYNYASMLDVDEIHDYLFFSQTLFNIISQHLKFDQQHLQPLTHRPVMFKNVPVRKAVDIHDDSVFQGSFHAWANYIHDKASRSAFTADEVQAYISSFAPLFVQYLHDQVSQLNVLVSNDILMPDHLAKIWSRFEEALCNTFDLYTDIALLIGCQDRAFTINGQSGDLKFPRLPRGTTTVVKKWHSRKYDSAWRFCSSDFSGRRRVISC